MTSGYRGNLSISSLYDLDDELVSEPLLDRLRLYWRINKNKGDSKYPLVWALLHAVRGAILVCVVPRLCFSALKLAEPFLLLRVVQYMDDTREEKPEMGYFLIVATGLVYMGHAVCVQSRRPLFNDMLTAPDSSPRPFTNTSSTDT